ncbi:P27 family phage terminase small subunit [Sulfurovum mangrovi]|uniref:P27 family phage terminase small subunit n=1 Tax=Sulfurovum mangrovi TaxID=2893889 RepID=UPI001E517668|nr:P27 family phage terminase small subunit [Sulfurovum mangrovi]UFH59825.1 P27 family phage terminase small subunit [Sulfurovum mangrovi]UFH59876.1 P27 family phage terminase small subunit [Sulfurovum mangrovi]
MNVTENNKHEYTPDDQIDWESMKWDYENTKCSFKKLGDKYNTYPMNVQRKAKDGGWVKFRPGAKEISQAVAKFDEKQSASSKPTAFLGTVGARKIHEIVHELGLHYSTVDEPLVIAYAESYERYLRLAKEVNKEGEVLISPKTGGEYLNPKFNAMQSVKNDLIKFGNQLGLSIAARKKLFIDLSDKEEQKSIFDMAEELSSAEDIDV